MEIKKLNDEKKASVAAQFAAEATLRRVHSAQKDDDIPPIEAILAPLEAELKIARQEVGYLMIFISAALITTCLYQESSTRLYYQLIFFPSKNVVFDGCVRTIISKGYFKNESIYSNCWLK